MGVLVLVCVSLRCDWCMVSVWCAGDMVPGVSVVFVCVFGVVCW